MVLSDIKQLWERNQNVENVNVVGWVKFNRDSGKIAFIELNDGTTIKNIQVVYKREYTQNFEEIKSYRVASAILVSGDLKITTNPKNPLEIVAKEVRLLKLADEDYPLQNKQHSNEFLREIAHLRVRSSTTQAIMHIRSQLSYGIHKFFHDNNFTYVASPIITGNDAEGAGENFILQDDINKPFFDKKAKLTVSGQLNAEAYALGLKKVYTFGPTFRAEKSHTNRHLAEFWMIEPEMAFVNLKQLMEVIELMLKNVITYTLNQCNDDFEFLHKDNLSGLEKIYRLTTQSFIRLEYAKAIEILQQAIVSGHNFEDNDIFFGKDLASEHERYLCEKHFNDPIFLYNFPKEIKAFYMKVNEDGQTVAACDLLLPGVGEIIGGSQREDNYDKLIERCHNMKINYESLQWYLDLRKYGYYMSSGFGLGLERIVMYLTGSDNIKDTIPFPRVEGELKF